jgi:4-hydroxybenzoate polyprenyltransferase
LKSLLVFRPLNILIVGVLQVITYYFLDFKTPTFNLEIVFLIVASVLITAAGYLFNDWMDQTSDTFNKPSKLYISEWSNLGVWIVFILFNLIALGLCYLISSNLVYWYAVVIALLLVYSVILKRLPLFGNFAISVLAAFSVYVVFLVFGTQDRKLVIFYAGFAALLTYLREIVKDMEDIEGDRKAGYLTLPVMAGLPQSRMVVLITGVFTLAAYGNLLYQWLTTHFKMPVKVVFVGYQVLCVLIPLMAFVYLSYKANAKSDYARLSRLAKYIMATGMLSMMFY